MIGIERRKGVEEPLVLWHPIVRRREAPGPVTVLAHDLLVDLLDDYCPLRWSWAGTGLQV